MSSGQLPTPLSRADYDTIEAAVMETERGRWFLAEFARRNRHSDTERVLDAIARLQDGIARQQAEPSIQGLRSNLSEMADAIARAHSEISAIRGDGLNSGRLYEATGELDAVVRATEQATMSILGATERLQEHAWTLREQGMPEAQCDQMDSCATEIYAACGFQDITAQRTRKVIDTLNFVEGRIKAMLAACSVDLPDLASASTTTAASPTTMWPPSGSVQQEVDRAMAAGAAAVAPARPAQPQGTGAFERLDSLSVEERLRLHH